jgi:group II intron reverse transcriptase/maturase
MLMEEILAWVNVEEAIGRVESNRGAPGVDGMRVEELRGYVEGHWGEILQQLLEGSYRPSPVLRREIPKGGGGVRQLGIPTVLDRMIQQAILQVLQPRLDPTFSEHSYGFRPGRSAHQAVRAAKRYVESGREWVVDIDLERFFDRVNHDVLMERLSRRVSDKRLLRLIRRYLEAGVLADGLRCETYEGTPQGGPLSPLLANVLLDEVDRELERRGHAFVRYADDCNVYVQTPRAGERVMASLRKQYAKLRLRVNESKSRVARAKDGKFLGFRIRRGKLGVAPSALQELKRRVRVLTRRTRGVRVQTVIEDLRKYLGGWRAYFGVAETLTVFWELDKWIRRRLRLYIAYQWRQGPTAYRALRRLGVPEQPALAAAAHLRRWWKTSQTLALSLAYPNQSFDALGLPRLGPSTSTRRTAGRGPACPVVWEGCGG